MYYCQGGYVFGPVCLSLGKQGIRIKVFLSLLLNKRFLMDLVVI